MPEQYDNLKHILEEIGIECLEFSVSADIKMLLLIIGKSSGNLTHGCPFCDMASPYDGEDYLLYTLGDLLRWHQKYHKAGKPHKKQSQFNNIINPPLLSGPLDRKIIELLNIPSLHLFLGNLKLFLNSTICSYYSLTIFLGVVDKLLKELGKNLFPSRGKECGEDWVESFLKRNGIIRKKKQGKAALEGNQCDQLLSKLDILERDILKDGCGEAVVFGLPFVKTFRDFHKVVQSCFRSDLQDGYKDDIATFSSSYKSLGISVTPKVICLG